MAYVHRTDPELRGALERWIGAEQEGMTRIDAVRQAAEIGRLAHEVLDQRVLEARAFNHSWTHIADAVGITRQSAHKRWCHLEEPARALAEERQARFRSTRLPAHAVLDDMLVGTGGGGRRHRG